MATECFCGCGRKVRFATKRASKFGARARHLKERLTLSQRMRADKPEQLAVMNKMIEAGQSFENFWAGIAHGGVAPTTDVGITLRREFHAWEAEVERLTAADRELPQP